MFLVFDYEAPLSSCMILFIDSPPCLRQPPELGGWGSLRSPLVALALLALRKGLGCLVVSSLVGLVVCVWRGVEKFLSKKMQLEENDDETKRKR